MQKTGGMGIEQIYKYPSPPFFTFFCDAENRRGFAESRKALIVSKLERDYLADSGLNLRFVGRISDSVIRKSTIVSWVKETLIKSNYF